MGCGWRSPAWSERSEREEPTHRKREGAQAENLAVVRKAADLTQVEPARAMGADEQDQPRRPSLVPVGRRLTTYQRRNEERSNRTDASAPMWC